MRSRSPWGRRHGIRRILTTRFKCSCVYDNNGTPVVISSVSATASMLNDSQGNLTNFTATLPTVQSSDAWAGKYIGLRVMSTFEGTAGGDGDWVFDNAQLAVSAVPEPGSLVLVATGCLAAGLLSAWSETRVAAMADKCLHRPAERCFMCPRLCGWHRRWPVTLRVYPPWRTNTLPAPPDDCRGCAATRGLHRPATQSWGSCHLFCPRRRAPLYAGSRNGGLTAFSRAGSFSASVI